MIAWDGSRVAARAVTDARDFLQRAQTVTIASVTDEKALPDDDPGSRLKEYLAPHFGHSRMRDFVMGGATTGILRDLELPVLLSH